MVYFKAIASYMSGSNIFGQWLWCNSFQSEYRTTTHSTQDLDIFLKRPKILQINWAYNIIQIGNKFYISGSWYSKKNQFVEVPLPDEYTDSNKIEDLLIVGNDYRLVLVSKSKNRICIIDFKVENEIIRIDNNIEEQVDNVQKRKKTDLLISKVVFVSDNCLYLTSTGDVFSGVVHPSCVDTRHCRGRICDIQCGYEHYALLTDAGLVYTWGNGRRLQLGHGDISNLEQPTEVDALGGIKITKISCGGWHSFALSESGDLYSWGWNDSGQLGIKSDGDPTESQSVPTLVDLFDTNGEEVITSVKDVACGSRHSAILLTDNTVWTSGYNKYGQLGCSQDKYPKISFFKKVFDCDTNCALMCGPWTTLLVKNKSIYGYELLYF